MSILLMLVFDSSNLSTSCYSHVKEAPYSADFGDFASFLSHMREQAVHRRKDLLVVDSGGKVAAKPDGWIPLEEVIILLLHDPNDTLSCYGYTKQQICTMATVFPTLLP